MKSTISILSILIISSCFSSSRQNELKQNPKDNILNCTKSLTRDTIYYSFFDEKTQTFEKAKPQFEILHCPNQLKYSFQNITSYKRAQTTIISYNSNGITNSETWINKRLRETIQFKYDQNGLIQSVNTYNTNKDSTYNLHKTENYYFTNERLDSFIYKETSIYSDRTYPPHEIISMSHLYDEKERLLTSFIGRSKYCSNNCTDTINYFYNKNSICSIEARKNIYNGVDYCISKKKNDEVSFEEIYKQQDGIKEFIQTVKVNSRFDEKNRLIEYQKSTEHYFNEYEKFEVKYSNIKMEVPFPNYILNTLHDAVDHETYFFTTVILERFPFKKITSNIKGRYVPQEIIIYKSKNKIDWVPSYKIELRNAYTR